MIVALIIQSMLLHYKQSHFEYFCCCWLGWECWQLADLCVIIAPSRPHAHTPGSPVTQTGDSDIYWRTVHCQVRKDKEGQSQVIHANRSCTIAHGDMTKCRRRELSNNISCMCYNAFSSSGSGPGQVKVRKFSLSFASCSAPPVMETLAHVSAVCSAFLSPK